MVNYDPFAIDGDPIDQAEQGRGWLLINIKTSTVNSLLSLFTSSNAQFAMHT